MKSNQTSTTGGARERRTAKRNAGRQLHHAGTTSMPPVDIASTWGTVVDADDINEAGGFIVTRRHFYC